VRYDSGFLAAVYFNGAFNLNPPFFKVCVHGGAGVRFPWVPPAAITISIGFGSVDLGDMSGRRGAASGSFLAEPPTAQPQGRDATDGLRAGTTDVTK